MRLLLSGLEKARHIATAPNNPLSSLLRPVLFSIVALTLGLGGPSYADAARLKKGSEPPQVSWTDVEGKEFTWSELRQDRPLVMVFWATWCSVCKKDWTKLKKLASRYEESELAPVWVSVSLGEPAERVAPVAEKYGLPGRVLVDPKETNGKKLGVEFVPNVCVLDTKGRVAYIGAPTIKTLNTLLGKLSVAPEETD